MANPNLYIGNTGGILLLSSVDDMLLTCPPQAATEVEEIKTALAATYKITKLGTARHFLAIEIKRKLDGRIGLGQRPFINSVLKRFSMESASNGTTPLYDKVKLDLINEIEIDADSIECQGIVGSVKYIAFATRRDISFAVAAISCYNSNSFICHLTATKTVLWYLKATRDYQLHPNTHSCDHTRHTDSERANDSADWESLGGQIFFLSGTIFWQSLQQHILAMSTLEAEYIACSEASGEGKWLLQQFKDIKQNWNDESNETKPLPILCDNDAALAHTTNGVIKSRTRHIDVCYNHSWDLYKRGIVNYSWISTHGNVADIFMKAFGRQKYQKFTKLIGLWLKALITKFVLMHLYFSWKWDGRHISGYGQHCVPA